MATLAQLRTALQTRGYATDTATAQSELLNSVYRRIIGMRRWPWLEVANNTALSTVAGTVSVDIDAVVSDFLHLDAVRLTFGTDYLEPEYIRPQEYRELAHSYRDQGAPRYWTRIDDDLYFWPTPDKAYTINLDYTKDPPDLTADGDSPIFDDTYHDVLVWGAIAELTFRERDPDGYSMANAQYGQRLNDMMLEYGVRQRHNSSRVVRTGTWDYLKQDTPGGPYGWPVW